MPLSYKPTGSKILAEIESIASPEQNYFAHFDMRYPVLLTKRQDIVYSENELFSKKLLNWACLYLFYSEITLGNTVHLRTNMAISVHNTYPSKGLFFLSGIFLLLF